MCANAKRDGRPAEYKWCRLRKFCNSIPCTMVQSLAASIGERKTWTQSELCTWQNPIRGQEPPKMYT